MTIVNEELTFTTVRETQPFARSQKVRLPYESYTFITGE